MTEIRPYQAVRGPALSESSYTKGPFRPTLGPLRPTEGPFNSKKALRAHSAATGVHSDRLGAPAGWPMALIGLIWGSFRLAGALSG